MAERSLSKHCQLGNSEVDPDYNPSVDDANRTSPKHTPRKRQRMESDPHENTPLKYIQVSADAMRVITQDPEQSECAHQEPFIPACSDMERDNSEIPTSAVPTYTQVSVVECIAAPTSDTSIQASPEPVSTQRGRKRRRNECSWKDVTRKKSLNLRES
ncbi:hypothetical protein ElyMa_002735700 [Elysia marginata]|uniref:Uncharacterized protein n=1 Tax=Elysia marginata TaxID=1093978 RepID=A0AAV4HIY4_9GAST|nr:hypothetical protein ElyMa_002735700 [Elysia marginata]